MFGSLKNSDKTEMLIKNLLEDTFYKNKDNACYNQKNIEAMLEKIDKQVAKGINKYGGTLDDKNLSEKELINHAVEEGIDFVFYLLSLSRKFYTSNKSKFIIQEAINPYQTAVNIDEVCSIMLNYCLELENLKEYIND